MTLTTAQAFAEFCSRISLTEVQKSEVSSKRASTENSLRASFPSTGILPVDRVILIGSADRGTLIRPLDDIDVMVEFTNKDDIFEQYRTDSGAFLQRIRTALKADTQISHIGARGQAVRLFYQSGAHVDIAPVFHYNTGGFALPSGDGGWITTDPEAQASWLSQRRTTVGSNLTPVIKLAKRWNRVHSSRFQSFHLEVIVATIFKTVGGNHRNAMKCFFDWAATRIDVSDPAGHSGPLSDYMSWDSKTDAVARFSNAKARAEQALAAESRCDHAEAKRLWKIELGDEFPTN